MEGGQGRGRAFALWTIDQPMNQPWDIEAGSKGVGLDKLCQAIVLGCESAGSGLKMDARD